MAMFVNGIEHCIVQWIKYPCLSLSFAVRSVWAWEEIVLNDQTRNLRLSRKKRQLGRPSVSFIYMCICTCVIYCNSLIHWLYCITFPIGCLLSVSNDRHSSPLCHLLLGFIARHRLTWHQGPFCASATRYETSDLVPLERLITWFLVIGRSSHAAMSPSLPDWLNNTQNLLQP